MVIGFARSAEGGRNGGSHVASGPLTPTSSLVQPLLARLKSGPGRVLLFVDGGEAALVSVQVYDVRGRLLGSTQRWRAERESTAIELSEVARSGPGITFVRVQVGSETRVVRSIRLD